MLLRVHSDHTIYDYRPPFRAGDKYYNDFISRHIDDAVVVFVYVAEAHFVERDDEGNYVDGELSF